MIIIFTIKIIPPIIIFIVKIIIGGIFMKDIIQQIMVDFQNSELPQPAAREINFPKLKKNLLKAHVLVGMRRSGKTWTMYQEMHNLLSQGVTRQQLVYLNFEDDRLLPFNATDFQSILEAYFELWPQYANSNEVYFFLDEIHEIPGWEKFIRRLLDQEKIQIYISGSSAKLLSKEIATTLRGRTITQEIFPFNFREYLLIKRQTFPATLTTKQKANLANHAKNFFYYGGFPETIGAEKTLHRRLLQNYIDIVIFRDVIERHQIANTTMVREFIRYCLHNISSWLSVNRLFQRFKSQGKTIGKNSLYEFMQYLEDAYCIFAIPLYTLSLQQQNLNPKKIFCIDQGLITAYSMKQDFEDAARLENIIFCKLRRKTEKIFYYKTRQNQEVDFLVISEQNKMTLIQACVSLAKENIYKREINALKQAMQELKIKQGYIVTISDKQTITTPYGKITVLPLWEWLLYD